MVKIKKTTEQFIAEAIAVHGDKYDYRLVEYINNSTKVKIICLEHGIFEQNPKSHLKGNGCNKCALNIKAFKLKKTTEEFIEEAKLIHGDKYDYSLINYVNNKTKIKIICPIHGLFEQRPNDHLSGKGCRYCSVEENSKKKTLTTEQFVERAKLIHNDKYDYSLLNYKNSNTKVKIVCNKCSNVFEQLPFNHLSGQNCPNCVKVDTEQFIERAKLIHGNKYDYSLVDYKSNITKVKIICPFHGVFEQIPSNHLAKNGCPECGKLEAIKNKTKTTEEFIKEAKLIHDDKYDYSLVEYKSVFEEIKIICPKHGVFLQKPNNHLNGHGCRKCKESRGEKKIRKILEKTKIVFEQQKKFKDLKDKNLLSYDFHIPSKNLLIEYNGEQHYKKGKFKNHDLLLQKHHDWLKRKYAKDSKINLLIIPYWEFNNIEKILEEKIGQ